MFFSKKNDGKSIHTTKLVMRKKEKAVRKRYYRLSLEQKIQFLLRNVINILKGRANEA